MFFPSNRPLLKKCCWQSSHDDQNKKMLRFSLLHDVINLFWRVVAEDVVLVEKGKKKEKETWDEKDVKSYFSTLLKRPSMPKVKEEKPVDPSIENDIANSEDQVNNDPDSDNLDSVKTVESEQNNNALEATSEVENGKELKRSHDDTVADVPPKQMKV